MATDYNANLIAELYATQSVEKATQISDEMVEIGDAVFPRQIYEAYKRFHGTVRTHYFVSDLTNFETGDAAEILKEISLTTDSDADISMMIDYLTNIKYFDPVVVGKVKKRFEQDVQQGDIYEYDIERYSAYLEQAGADMDELKSSLQKILEDDRQAIDTRKMALKKLLKLQSKKYIRFYYENYDSIKSKKLEVIFVEEISTWHGGIIPLLHQKISEVGSDRAKEILKNAQSKKAEEKQNKDAKEQTEVKEEYQTADAISEIAGLRSKINKISVSSEKFGFPFFPASEEIYQQGIPARNKAELIGYCMVLRFLLGNFDAKITDFLISEERAKELIPDIQDLKGSINKFHFMLLDKGIEVDASIWGLRDINRIVSKLAHPGEGTETQLLDILKKEGLSAYYKDDNWSMLHREILLKYKSVLIKIMGAIGTQLPR